MAKKTRIIGGVARKSTGHSPAARSKYEGFQRRQSSEEHRKDDATEAPVVVELADHFLVGIECKMGLLELCSLLRVRSAESPLIRSGPQSPCMNVKVGGGWEPWTSNSLTVRT